MRLYETIFIFYITIFFVRKTYFSEVLEEFSIVFSIKLNLSKAAYFMHLNKITSTMRVVNLWKLESKLRNNYETTVR